MFTKNTFRFLEEAGEPFNFTFDRSLFKTMNVSFGYNFSHTPKVIHQLQHQERLSP